MFASGPFEVGKTYCLGGNHPTKTIEYLIFDIRGIFLTEIPTSGSSSAMFAAGSQWGPLEPEKKAELIELLKFFKEDGQLQIILKGNETDWVQVMKDESLQPLISGNITTGDETRLAVTGLKKFVQDHTTSLDKVMIIIASKSTDPSMKGIGPYIDKGLQYCNLSQLNEHYSKQLFSKHQKKRDEEHRQQQKVQPQEPVAERPKASSPRSGCSIS